MRYTEFILALIILIQLLRMIFLRKKLGEKKGDFIAMTLMLSAIPFIFLSNIAEKMQRFLVVAVLINWFYSFYVLKSRK